MAFWGVELKPGKPYTHQYEDERGRLHVSQATLGNGSTNKKSIVQCKVGDNKPIYMCSLLPEKLETCQLNLEFEEEEEVTFSVVGSHTVHLSGFFYGESEDGCGHEHGSDLYDDTAETDSGSDDSIEFEYDSEDEDDDDSIDDEFDMYHLPNSGVKIEEIVEDENPTDENGTSKRPKKKKKQSNGSENSERQIVVKKNADVQLLESEDEDGFPVSASNENKADSVKSKLKSDGMKDQDTREEALEKKAINNVDQKKGLKRVSDDISQANDHPRGDNTSAEKNKKNKKKKLMHGDEVAHENGSKSSVHQKQAGAEVEPVPVGNTDDGQRSADDKVIEKKKKKKKNNNNQQDGITVADVELDKKDGSQMKVEKNPETKPSQVRSYGNGLVIEELAMGKPDGKRASPGKKVSVHYIGKLKKNGKIFDSNIGRSPFKFRLGVGQVIKGWDVGVSGMRIGDKRRITIPPAMGYGSKGAGADIPPNSWLVFDVELKDVN